MPNTDQNRVSFQTDHALRSQGAMHPTFTAQQMWHGQTTAMVLLISFSSLHSRLHDDPFFDGLYRLGPILSPPPPQTLCPLPPSPSTGPANLHVPEAPRLPTRQWLGRPPEGHADPKPSMSQIHSSWSSPMCTRFHLNCWRWLSIHSSAN